MINNKNFKSLLLLKIMIEFDISITFWILDLINNIIFCFLSTMLIGKIISLFENPFISFTTAKILLINFIFQILLLLNFISIFIWFFTVNFMTSAQILPKFHSDSASTETLTEFLWNLNKVFIALTRNCLNNILLTLFNPISSSPTSFSLTLSSHLFNFQIFNCASSY